MTDRLHPDHDERGLSARQLVLVFLGIVTVCAVFFAAGFLVGYNERTSKELPITERVTPSSIIPPTVNPPMKSEGISSMDSAPKSKPAEPTPVPEEHVRAASPPPAPHEAPPAARPAAQKESGGAGRFVLQVAATGSRQDADEVAKGLKARGFPAFVVSPPQANAGDKLYRVQVGPYPTREAAEQAKPKLEQVGFKQPFIKH
jgi:cell division septation protein DedD